MLNSSWYSWLLQTSLPFLPFAFDDFYRQINPSYEINGSSHRCLSPYSWASKQTDRQDNFCAILVILQRTIYAAPSVMRFLTRGECNASPQGLIVSRADCMQQVLISIGDYGLVNSFWEQVERTWSANELHLHRVVPQSVNLESCPPILHIFIFFSHRDDKPVRWTTRRLFFWRPLNNSLLSVYWKLIKMPVRMSH